MLLSDGRRRNFLKKESLLSPLGFSHVSVDNTVVYSSPIKLSVCALHVCLEDAKQMTGAIARGRKTHLSQTLQRALLETPAPASKSWTSHTFSLSVLSLTVGRLH